MSLLKLVYGCVDKKTKKTRMSDVCTFAKWSYMGRHTGQQISKCYDLMNDKLVLLVCKIIHANLK